ncbi:MAG: helix-hairpin-helix domain-containing protein [Solobacterium sp.]|nr:helix-hairpin-helix domain-containing protein [Solobacterium sp.]
MKQLLIFFALFAVSFAVDLNPVSRDVLRGDSITVTVTGEVADPGPRKVEPYTTVGDLLDQITLNETADLSVLNPDTVLNDHDVLVIPCRKQENEAQRISINSSDEEQLTALKGIGPSTARKICEYRAEHGLFQQTEDLMLVPGIGRAKYEAISDQITL